MVNLSGKVCLVTGGSKGIGRGIALQLGKAGATVYVTGRTKSALESCCYEINLAGGKGIPMVVDHSKDNEVEQLFKKIGKEQQGRLDVMVNNAYSAINMIFKNGDEVPFWEMPAGETWDIVNNVGLRNHYLCTVYAARWDSVNPHQNSFNMVKHSYTCSCKSPNCSSKLVIIYCNFLM